MELIFKKPEFEPRFVATVYTTDNPEVYRVNIGREATDTGMGNDVMPSGDYVAQSGFLDRTGVEEWVVEEVRELDKSGRRVEFDENAGYKMTRVLDELAAESPIII